MKGSWPPLRVPVADEQGFPSKELLQYLQQLRDQPLGQLIVTEDDTLPPIRKHQTILWKSDSLATTYIVYYDGTSKYFWEVDGVDLY